MSAPESDLVVGPEATSSSASNTPKKKPAPQKGKLPLQFVYHPSPDGVDENLLIMLHGLGDTEAPFANLGRQLRLPQTAVLSLRAPGRIPYLYEEAFQWYESFDQLGELLTNPNPTPALDLMTRVLEYLVSKCSWPADRIHLFGFGQGGSLAAELALKRWKTSLPAPSSPAVGNAPASTSATPASLPLGSVVSVEGPLLSFPTVQPKCSIPILFFHHSPPSGSSSALTSFKKGFSAVNEARFTGQEGMPRSKEEWAKVVEFWSRVLSARIPDMEGLHPVISGGPAPPGS